jgi:hypothetical protein
MFVCPAFRPPFLFPEGESAQPNAIFQVLIRHETIPAFDLMLGYEASAIDAVAVRYRTDAPSLPFG